MSLKKYLPDPESYREFRETGPRILSKKKKTKVQLVEAWRVQFASNEKKTDRPKSAAIDDYFTFLYP